MSCEVISLEISRNIYLNLNHECMLHDWTLLCHMGVNTSYNYLKSHLEELLAFYVWYNVNVIRPTKKNVVPWMIKSLIKSSTKCRKLHIISTSSLECRNKDIKYRNVLTRLKEIWKREYYNNTITSFKGDLKGMWKFLHGYIHRQNDNLNLHFSTVCKELAKKFSTMLTSLKTWQKWRKKLLFLILYMKHNHWVTRKNPKWEM